MRNPVASLIEFNIDPKALVGAIALLFLLWGVWKWRQRFQKPAIRFSDIQSLEPKRTSLKQLLAQLPNGLKVAALALFLLALIDPHSFADRTLEKLNPNPTEGIAIYLVLDESGSMMEKISMQMPDGTRKTAPKIDLLKEVTKPFILQHPNDLIGLVSFARVAHVQVPLTLDHQEVIDKMLQLHPSISEEEGGTAIGYAIYKTANLILATKHFAEDLIQKGEPAYTIKNSIIVLVTDGVQNVNPEDRNNPFRSMDIAEAAAYLKQNGLKFYIINIDPGITAKEFEPHRHLMQRAAESTGGKFYIAEGPNNLDSIYHAIDQVEKSMLPPPPPREERYRKGSLYPYLIAAGMVCLLLGILLTTTLLRKTP